MRKRKVHQCNRQTKIWEREPRTCSCHSEAQHISKFNFARVSRNTAAAKPAPAKEGLIYQNFVSKHNAVPANKVSPDANNFADVGERVVTA